MNVRKVKRCGLLDRPLCTEIPVLQPSRFYRRPSGRNHFKVVRGLDVWKLCLAIYLQNLWFILVKKLATFGFVVDVFRPRKFKLILRRFKLISRRK